MGNERHSRAELEQRLGELMQQQRDLVERLQQGQAYFQQLARSVWRVQEEERRKLARELHDGIGQNLTAMVHLIGQARSALPAAANQSRDRLEQMHALAETTLQETRALSRLLRPQILDDLGLEAALRWLARTLGESHGIDISLDLAPELPALGGDLATLIFRIVQESLANVARHAHAQHAAIELQRRGPRLLLRVRDDGRGCDTAAALAAGSEGRSSGLGGMRDRVRLFGGELRIDSAPGAGFGVAIELPLAQVDETMQP